MSEEKKGGCGGVIWLIILLVGGYIVVSNVMDPPPTEFQKLQMDPESAFQNYVMTVRKFDQDPFSKGGTMGDVFKCLPKKDMDWFEANYKSLDFDAFDLASGINPADADTMARVKALSSLVSGGPTNEVEILSKKVEGDKATFVAKQYYWQDENGKRYSHDYTVVLIKDGKYWYVKDFGGGRK